MPRVELPVWPLIDPLVDLLEPVPVAEVPVAELPEPVWPLMPELLELGVVLVLPAVPCVLVAPVEPAAEGSGEVLPAVPVLCGSVEAPVVVPVPLVWPVLVAPACDAVSGWLVLELLGFVAVVLPGVGAVLCVLCPVVLPVDVDDVPVPVPVWAATAVASTSTMPKRNSFVRMNPISLCNARESGNCARAKLRHAAA